MGLFTRLAGFALLMTFLGLLFGVAGLDSGLIHLPSLVCVGGFFLFGAMCGWEGGNFPHRQKHGIFFADGEVRDVDACVAIQSVAIAQGIDPTSLTSSFVQKSPTASGYFRQFPLPDGHDFEDTVRSQIEERSSLSPDSLTGMEANLRFAGPETMKSKIFGRLSAWQNWIFIRPNATGPSGALTLYGKPERAQFDWSRV